MSPHRLFRPPLHRGPSLTAATLLTLCGLLTALPVRANSIFKETSDSWGVSFDHFNGMTGAFYFPEMTGQGGALLDYDGDGDLDLYFRQGTLLASSDSPDPELSSPPDPPGDRLFRNDLFMSGHGPQPRFVDRSAEAKLAETGYGMGIAAGDYDDDGDLDLYLTNYGENVFLQNSGDGSFVDVTDRTGTGDPRWSTSAAFFDFDQDGHLDLFSVNYVHFDVEENPACFSDSSARDYCGPANFEGQADRLWRNVGDGRFEDVSIVSGVGRRSRAGLGVVVGTFNDDDRPDVYVLNDGQPNFLWLNAGDGAFVDDGLFSGTAVNRHGTPEASMGIAAADFDGDLDEDLFLTHLAAESNTLYRRTGAGVFEDRSIESKLAAPSLPFTSFGVAALDFENDGWLDLVVANGAVKTLVEQARQGVAYPLQQPNQLFRNLGDGTFVEVSHSGGRGITTPEVSRGLAQGDLDNDGKTDVAVFNNNGRARLLHNRSATSNRWLGVTGVRPGTTLEVLTEGGRRLRRRVRLHGSYASVGDARVVFGLAGEATQALEFETGSKIRRRVLEPPTGSYLLFFD